MKSLPLSVINFAAGNTSPYIAFVDYYNHYRANSGIKSLSFDTTISFDEKEKRIKEALLKEILRVSGINSIETFSLEVWATNPNIQWAAFAVVSAMIDSVLPDSLIQSIGAYTDVRSMGHGDSMMFEITPRDLFVVSKAGRNMRQAQVQKQFKGNVSLVPELRELTVGGVSLYAVLAGKESLAEMTVRAVRSLETQMAYDVYDLFNTTMAALPTTPTAEALRIAGYTQDALVSLGQRITAWNGGAKAMVMGTQLALQDVLPANANYRYTLDDGYVKLGYIPTAFGFDLMVLPQVADYKTPFSVKLDDAKLYVVSPSQDKLVKLVLEGSTYSYLNAPFDKANLTQNATFFKSWGLAIATSAVAGVITLA